MNHRPSSKAGVYKTGSNNFEIYFEHYTGIRVSNYSATREGLIQLLKFWRSGSPPLIHGVQFKSKTNPKIQFYLDYQDEKLLCLNSNGRLCSKTVDDLITDYNLECIVHSGVYPQQNQIHAIITAKMDLIFSEYAAEIAVATTNDEKIIIIATHIQRIAQLHPFDDGNIRTCYIAMNKLLSDHNLPLSILLNPNKFDACSLDMVVAMIQEGQRIYLELLQHTDPEAFCFTTSESHPSLQKITCFAYDLGLPELVAEFGEKIICRHHPQISDRYQSGLFAHRPNPYQSYIDQCKQLSDSTLATHRKILTIVENHQFSTALRNACWFGADALIEFFLEHRFVLNIEINEKSSSNGNTALDWFDAHMTTINQKDRSKIREKLCQAGALNQHNLQATDKPGSSLIS